MSHPEENAFVQSKTLYLLNHLLSLDNHFNVFLSIMAMNKDQHELFVKQIDYLKGRRSAIGGRANRPKCQSLLEVSLLEFASLRKNTDL